jgi:hypothetical protein
MEKALLRLPYCNKNLDKSSLDIFYTNADSLSNKMHELKIILQSLASKPKIIAITEVKNKRREFISNDEFNIDGYNLYIPMTSETLTTEVYLCM